MRIPAGEDWDVTMNDVKERAVGEVSTMMKKTKTSTRVSGDEVAPQICIAAGDCC